MSDAERARRQPPARVSLLSSHVAEGLERMDAALRRRLADACRIGDLGELEHPAPPAEGLEHGERLLHRIVEERIARRALSPGLPPSLPRRHGARRAVGRLVSSNVAFPDHAANSPASIID